MWASREHILLLYLISFFSLALSGGSSPRQPSREVYLHISLGVPCTSEGVLSFLFPAPSLFGGRAFINTFAWRCTRDRVGQICSRVSLFFRIKDYVHLVSLHNVESDCLDASGKKLSHGSADQHRKRSFFIFKVLTSAIYVQGQQKRSVKASKRNKKGTLSLICGVFWRYKLGKARSNF